METLVIVGSLPKRLIRIPTEMTPRHYVLHGQVAVPASLSEWTQWFKTANRDVAEDWVADVRVSTVFLGIDTTSSSSPPRLFETMIFGGPHDRWQQRYGTWDEAAAGHDRVCRNLREGQHPAD